MTKRKPTESLLSKNETIENLENEIWKDIIGYEGLYQISNFGRLKSVSRFFIDKSGRQQFNKEKLKKCRIGTTGYYITKIYKNNICMLYKIHRLVAMHFVENTNKEEYNIIDHIDGNPLNNHFSNLRWTTLKGNMENPISKEKMSKSSAWKNCKAGIHPACKKVIRIDLDNRNETIYLSIKEAAFLNKMNQDTITKYIKLNKPYKNFNWRYYEYS